MGQHVLPGGPRWPIVASLLLGLAVTAGCSGPSDPRPSTIEQFKALAALPSRAQGDEDAAVVACMKTAGFTVETPVLSSPTGAGPDAAGYGIGDTIAGNGVVRSVEDSIQRLDPDDRGRAEQALLGDPRQEASVTILGARVTVGSQGCLAQVRAKMYGSLESFLNVYYGAQIAYAQMSIDRDGKLKEHLEPYRSCIAALGYTFTSPDDAYTQARKAYDELDRSAAESKEVEIAQVDRRCRAETGYQKAADDELARATEAWVSEHADLVNSWYEKLPAAYRGEATAHE